MNLVVTIPITLFISLGGYLVNGNRKFFNILNDFKKKLPPSHKKAKVGVLAPYGFTHIDTSKMQTHIDSKELDLFLKQLEDFDYSSIYFKRKQILSYSNNLQRHLKNYKWEKFGIAIIQQLLEDEKWEHSKPYLLGSKVGKIIKF